MTRKHDKSLPKPPSHLSAESRKWWTGIVEKFEIQDYQLPILTGAAECLDRIAEVQKNIGEKGIFRMNRLGSRVALPEIAVEKSQKVLFARLVRELCLDGAPSEPPRPPRLRYR